MGTPKPVHQKKKTNLPPKKPDLQKAPSEGKVRKKSRLEFIYLGIILIVTTLAFSSTFQNDFIETWDDGVYVTDNMTIRNINSQNLKTWFTTSINGTYVPLPLLSFAIDYQLFKLDPGPYHIENLLLHLIVTALAFFFLKKLKINPLFAAFAALLFGIHPMRVESVAWITERKDLLFSIFYLSSLLSYLALIHTKKARTRYYLLTFFFFLLSLFSKIQAVTLPLCLLLLDYYFSRPLKMKLLWEKIPHFALSLAFGLFGIFFLEKTGSLDINVHYTLVDRIFFGLYSLATYLVKLIYPAPLSVFYPYPMSPGNALPVHYYLSPLFLLVLGFLVYLSRKKTRVIVFGSLFFLVNIMFLLQILGAGQAYMADRFTYIPYLGLFFILGWAAQYFSERYPSLKAFIFPLMILVPVVLFSTTLDRCRDWKDSHTIWTDVIEKYPKKIPTAYANRASYYRKTGEWEKAISDYNLAIHLDSSNAVSRMNRGNLFFDKGNFDVAYDDYQKALKMNGLENDLPKLYANLGAIYGIRKIYDSAFYTLNLSIKMDSTFPNAYLNRGLMYENSGNPDSAIRDYMKYLTFKPEDDRVYTSIGVNYQIKKDYRESIRWFDEGIRRNPSAGVHYSNRSISNNVLGEVDKARQDAIKALELGFQVNPEYLARIGLK